MQGYVIQGDQVVWQENGLVHTGIVASVSDDGCWANVVEDGAQDERELPASILEHQAL